MWNFKRLQKSLLSCFSRQSPQHEDLESLIRRFVSEANTRRATDTLYHDDDLLTLSLGGTITSSGNITLNLGFIALGGGNHWGVFRFTEVINDINAAASAGKTEFRLSGMHMTKYDLVDLLQSIPKTILQIEFDHADKKSFSELIYPNGIFKDVDFYFDADHDFLLKRGACKHPDFTNDCGKFFAEITSNSKAPSFFGEESFQNELLFKYFSYTDVLNMARSLEQPVNRKALSPR